LGLKRKEKVMLQTYFKKAKVTIIALALIGIFSQMLVASSAPVQAEKPKYSFSQTSAVDYKIADSRAIILQAYLAKYNSPLQGHAQDFIEAADKYGVDWKLVPAISGVESTFGNAIPYNSYNGWGYGVYGDNVRRFQSWKDGIYVLNSDLKSKYIDKGYTDPYSMNRIYASSPTWGVRVDGFMKDIAEFSQEYQEENQPVLSKTSLNPAESNDSASLASK
jgi:hypothetical protein